MDTVWERVYLIDSRIVRFRELADSFFFLTSPPADVAVDPRSHGFTGTVHFKGQGQDVVSSGVTEVALFTRLAMDEPVTPVPLSEECLVC